MRSKFAPGMSLVASSVAVFVGFGAFLYWLSSPPSSGPNTDPIVVFCAEALRIPMESIAAQYEKEAGQKVELNIGPSQALLGNLGFSQGEPKACDLFLPADDSFIALARKKGLIRETIPLATMSAVVVAHPNARPIKAWNDLMSPEVELILGSPETSAIGALTRESLAKSKLWDQIEARKPTFQLKIGEVASAALINPRAAGIVFDAVAAQYPKLNVTHLPELDGIHAKVAIGVASSSKQPTFALRFARYVAGKNRGLVEFAKRSYHIIDDADEYFERPELRLFGGTMLRPAIEETIKEFQAREGVAISTNWNGCGILVGEMKANKIPDLYFACEPRFMDKVQDLFGPRDVVSSNRLVIGVRKGNPFGVRSLKDLAKDGLKVGIGNENQCALGDLTMQTFNRTGLSGRIRKNIAKEAPSGDLLISDFRAGALDVIVCYESNVTPYLKEMDFVPIDIGSENADCTNPLQPVAIAKACRTPQLARRLMDAMQTPESRAQFERLGFGWVKDGGAK